MMNPTSQNVASDSFNEIATVRIELRHTDPLIWRQVEVPTSITLKVLHDIIQVVMGWFDYHLWEFTVGKQRYGLPMDDDWGTKPRIEATKVRLRDVTDLFLGTGAGTKAYSIVEQGKVGLIVSAKPEARSYSFTAAGESKGSCTPSRDTPPFL